MKKITTAARDLATALVVMAVAFALFVYFELFENLDGWLRRYEVLEFDELILLPFVLAVLLGVYYWRERKVLKREMARRERIGEDLRRSEAGLVAAQRIARVGNFEYDFGKDEARWSDEMYRIFGFEPGSFVPTYRTFFGSVHPDDKKRLREAVRGVLYHGRRDDVEYRVVRPDGESRCVNTRCEVVYGEEGEPLKLVGTVQDVTERVRTEQALREAQERYRVLVEHVPAAIYVDDVDETNSVIYRSPHALEVLGYATEEFLSDPEFWQDLLHPDDRERVLTENERTNETGEPFRIEYRMRRKDGRYVWLRDEAVLISDEEGNPKFWQGYFSDITDRKEAEEKLREAEERYRTLVEQIPGITYIEDFETQATLYDSPQVEEILGYPADTYLEDPYYWSKIVHPDDRERLRAEEERSEVTGKFALEYRCFASDGRIVWLREESKVVRDADGTPRFWHGVILDVTERVRAEEAVRRSEAGLAQAQRMAGLGSWEWDARTGQATWSDETYRIHGFEPGSFTPSPRALLEAVHPDDRELVEAEMDGSPGGNEPYDFEYRLVRPDGETRVVRRRAEVVFDEGGEPVRMFGTLQDVTERKVLEERLEHQAMHDPLTGLSNRAKFTERLQQALARAGRRTEKTAVLFLDLDNFKYVNDSLGHEAGDGLLVAVAERLASCVRAGDTLARLGGDEFTVLLEGVSTADAAVSLAERILERLREPFEVNGHLVAATASIGISMNFSDEDRAEDLLRDADAAMYRSKEKGKNQHEVFDANMKEHFVERLGLETDLRRAIEQDEFVLHYQPMVSIGAGVILGTEALIRWEHPRRGLVSPADFVRVAEETELITPIGRWVLREACRQAREWRELHPAQPPLTMSVNLSASQFRTPGLVEDVSRVLFELGLDPRGLLLEITESVAMDDTPSTMETLRELKALGVRIGIDDFGTGHTSLAYLKRFPVDFLKIDRSFVAGFDRDRENQAIVAAVIRLAHDLNIEVIAEGVETAEQLARLREMGCDAAQGYYWWRPLPSRMLDTLIRTHLPR